MTGLLVIAHVALWAAVVAEGLLICVLLYQNNRLLQVAGQGDLVGGHLAVGVRAPQIRATNVRTGDRLESEQLAGDRTSILFVTPTCEECRRLVRDLSGALAGFEHMEGLIVCCAGQSAHCEAVFGRQLRELPFFADDDGSLSRQFGIRAQPALVELDAAWRIVGYSYPSSPDHVVRVLPQRALAGEQSWTG